MRLKNHLLIVKLFLENRGAFSTPIFAVLPRFIGRNCDVKQDDTLKFLKKTVFSKVAFAISMLFLITFSYGQNFKPFSPRFDSDVRGSMVMMGNNILGKDNNPYNVDSGVLSFNENIDMKYIDIDGDPDTFSSSSADLIMPNPQCFKIVYAGLYWGALLQTGSRSDINKIKLKIPGSSYQDVTGAIIYDANVAPIGTNADKPYACYADITALVQGATNPIGTYTVANITSSLGFNGTTGLAAGWNLIVIYEDPEKSAQSITTFDGFSAVSDGQTTVFDVSGFRSRPAGAVNLAFGIAGLEGDKDEVGSKLEINGKAITTKERPSNHFFNSTINNLAGNFTARNPNGSNTLGFDSGIISVPNPQQTVVENNATSAEISLQMARGKQGTYYSYFNVFAIDIIAPEIVLTKLVQDAEGNDASAANVVLGQNLFYVIGFQNTGNDPATQFTIRDVLPNNIIFNYPADITYLPPGVTATYDKATRSITFSIDKTLVEIGDPRYEIRFKVQVVPTCNQLSSACSNEIKNQAFATYRGLENPMLVTDDPSLPSYTNCNITTAPTATNFLVGVSGCSYGDSQVLCGNNVLLTASDGYASYSWSRDPSGVPEIGTGQTYLATQLGKYYVHNTAAPPCFLNIVEEITVVPFGNTVTNPVIPFADNVVTCSNDGKSLPLIYLCGANATRAIQSNVSDGSTIVWEKLNEASCAAVSDSNCANENSACTWAQVGTGPDYTATAAGQYRMTLNYSGGCFNRFYFNVYQNLLSPTVTKKDIVCSTPGRITVGGVPSDYEYSLSPKGPFQSSNVFNITTQNLYTVYIRQVGVTSNPCLFTVPDVFIRERNFTVSVVATAPLCNGGKGSLKLAANDVEPQYFYKISQGGVLINSVGPILASDYTFANLNSGVYDVEVSTEDGCIQAFQATVPDTSSLTASVTLTKPLTCTDGEITVYPVGGTPPYTYFVNNSTNYETSPVIAVSTAGIYTIDVFDANSCTARVSISVAGISRPTFDVVRTDLSCSDVAGDGTISLTNIVSNGNALRYSIDNGVTFLNSPIFTDLTAGNYNVVVEYTITYATGTSVCTTPPQSITIAVPMAIKGSSTLTAPYTCLQTAIIEAQSVSGGTGVYQYSINGTTFQTSNVFTGLTGGTYMITIKDANNCTFVTNAVSVAPLTPPTNLDFSATDLTCPSNTSNVTLSATGGFGLQMYKITAPAGLATPYQESNVFSELEPGTYTFQVKDEKDCTYQESYSIASLPTVAVVGQLVSNVQCFGTNTGSVRFTVSSSTGFTYTINGTPQGVGASPINLINQPAGTYTIVLTNTATNCTATTSVTIAQPAEALSMTTTVSPIKCNASGSAVVNATGGWGGNTYTLTQPDNTVLGPQASNTFTNLTQVGLYTASVTDSNNCTQTNTFTLSTPTPPTASIAGSDLCYDTTNQATIMVTAGSGVSPYTYSIDNGISYQASNTFSNLTPGNYTIIVKDAFGCLSTPLAQAIASQLTVNTVLTKDLDCSTPPDATITGTISGGYAGFSYKVNFNNGGYGTSVPVVGNIFTYNTTTPGTYQFQVTDSNNCPATSGTITINPLVSPVITSVVQTQQILCNGDSTAAIKVNIDNTKGTPAFVINVNNDTTGINYGTQTSGLPAGNYTITVTDAKFCIDTKTIEIAQPAPIVVNYHVEHIACVAGEISKGSIIIDSVTGGSPNYNYFVTGNNSYNAEELNSGNTTSEAFNVVDFGLYQINVVDINGCSKLIQNILVASPPNGLGITVTSPPADCSTGGQATVAVNSAFTGNGPFYFSIYTGPGQAYPASGTWLAEDPVRSKQTTFTNLLPGVTYTFIVYDDVSKCYYYQTAAVPIPTNSTLSATGITSNNITCKGNKDGNVSFSVKSKYGSPTNITYEIFNSLSLVPTGITGSGTIPAKGTLAVSNLGALPYGTYFVLIKEDLGATNAGCSQVTTNFTITESAIDLSVTASVIKNANCNPNSGVISAVAKNGTAPYLFQLTNSAIAPLSVDPLWASANTFNVNAGSYYAHVKDAYGCIKTTVVQIVSQDPTPVVAAVIANQCTPAEGNFAIDVTLSTAGTAPYSFAIDGGAFQTQTVSFTISNLSSGPHSVEIKDVNGCGNKVDLTILAPLGLTPTIKALPTCANNDGAITVNATGGSVPANYTYTLLDGTSTIITGPQPSKVFSGLAAGRYQVHVTDGVTTCSQKVPVVLSAPTPVTFTTSVTNVSCKGGNNGVIAVNLGPGINDNPVYTYEITGPTRVFPQTSSIFTGLTAGTYTVRVNSGRGCSFTDDVVVIEPLLALSVSGTATPFACAPDNSKTASTVTITELAGSGTSPYLYSIDGISYTLTNTFSVIDNGRNDALDIFVKDANGCIANGSVPITTLIPLTGTVNPNTPIDCNGTGSIAVLASGGSGNYSYQLLPGGVAQPSNIFNITTPGTYYFQVNDTETGCFITTAAYTVAPFNTIDVVATATTPVICFGDANGVISINVTGYTGAFDYEVFDNLGSSVVTGSGIAPTTQLIPGLSAGNFTVNVTEKMTPFCVKKSNAVKVASPALPLAVVANETANVTCANNQGTITATGTGGWGSLQYELVGTINVAYSTSSTFNNLVAGNYTVNVKDAKGCIRSSKLVQLSVPTPITVTASPNVATVSCNEDTSAVITVNTITGGSGNYLYTLVRTAPDGTVTKNGPQMSDVFNNLGAGTYQVLVSDDWSCSGFSNTIVIAQPTRVTTNLVVAATQTCLTQTRLTLSANGGTPPYTFSADGISYGAKTFDPSVTFPVGVGTYHYYVKDSNNCVGYLSNDITIDPLPLLVINLDKTNAVINCAGDNTGVIVATAQGGLGNYSYTLLNGSGAIVQEPTASGNFTGLFAGNYQIKVDSGDCATVSSIITITQPVAPLIAPYATKVVTCNGANNGMLTVNASGGTGIIKYAISPNLNQFFDTNIFDRLAPGNYDVIIQDVLGCYVKINFDITEPAPIVASTIPGTILPEICFGDKDGAFMIDVTGGVLPYGVSLDNPNGTYTTGTATQTQFDFIGLTGGTHTVYIRDANGCDIDWTVALPESIKINPMAVVDYSCVNNSATNTVTVTVDASIRNPADLDYSLDGTPYQPSNVFTNVAPGVNHFIDVRHTNGCIQRTMNFDIAQIDPLAITLNDGGLNEIVAVTTGGAGGNQYTLNGESYGTKSNFIVYKSGDYTVEVTDTNGCSATASRYFEFIDIEIPNVFTPNGDGNNDGWGPSKTINYPDLVFDIYDRYGRKIATYKEGQYWDGKYNSLELPSGDYWYVLKLQNSKDAREFVGHFTLYR
ncbi:T9SS type B sorting domain-containing protein [Flavobacterium sp. ZB4P23]|uniref:T9SS type B sorting domain-containing protein n=1 Tax=Flavobacterium sp. ZB4P23 TaxID=2497484 RepID=UPI000F8174BD|nr:T9SS type B sorting domain-containing protein [Flavobacterium sp. ZB4P23]RTY83908.1 T9SS type B sorting domain-containing protein [Flavobacterium sp. ZB4P23]